MFQRTVPTDIKQHWEHVHNTNHSRGFESESEALGLPAAVNSDADSDSDLGSKTQRLRLRGSADVYISMISEPASKSGPFVYLTLYHIVNVQLTSPRRFLSPLAKLNRLYL